MSNLIIHEEKSETTTQRRKRLSDEMRYVQAQFNTKIAELLEEGLDVDVVLRSGLTVSGEGAFIDAVESSYQTPRKYFR